MKTKITIFKIHMLESTNKSSFSTLKNYLSQTCTKFSMDALNITDHNSRNLLDKLSNVDVSRPINNIRVSMCPQ